MKKFVIVFFIIIFFSFNSVFAMAPPGPTIAVDRTDFLLGYTISGGGIHSATHDDEANSLILGISAAVDGELTITLPRELIDAKNGNVDDNFFVLVDGESVIFDEWSTTYSHRTLRIYFEKGAEEVKIIGSFIATSSSLDEITDDYKTIVIRGKIYENGTTVLDSDWFFTEKEPEIPFDNAGEIRISYYRDGEVVAETGFDYGPFCMVNGAMHCFDFMSLFHGIPYLDDIDKIVFSRSDNVLAEKIVSNNVPQVTVLYPNGGEAFMVGQKITIEWEGNDPDGDGLSYIVAYSRDGGEFWIPTTVDLEETEITGQFYFNDVTDSYSVKVIATDGFNTSFDTSDSTFSVTKYISPKKQLETGSESIICQEQLIPIFKASDNSPACVKPTTAEKLIERGWTTVLLDDKELEIIIPTFENIPIHKVNITGIVGSPTHLMKLQNPIHLQNNEIIKIEGKFSYQIATGSVISWGGLPAPNSVCLDRDIDVIKGAIVSATIKVLEIKKGVCTEAELIDYEILYDKNEIISMVTPLSYICEKIEDFVNEDRTNLFELDPCQGKYNQLVHNYYAWIPYQSKLVLLIDGSEMEEWKGPNGGNCAYETQSAVVIDLIKNEISEIYVDEPEKSCYWL